MKLCISPIATRSHSATQIELIEPGVKYTTVVTIPIRARVLARGVCHPVNPIPVSPNGQAIRYESIVRLIVADPFALDGAVGNRMGGQQADDSTESVTSVHENSRSLNDLHPVDRELVDFQSMFVTPLLTFLPAAIIEHDNHVESQSPHHRIRYPRACPHLSDAAIPRTLVAQLRALSRLQQFRADGGHRDGTSFQFCTVTDPGDDHLPKLRHCRCYRHIMFRLSIYTYA